MTDILQSRSSVPTLSQDDFKRENASHRRRQLLQKGGVYALLIFGSLLFVLPLILMVSTSMKSIEEITTYPPTFFPNNWLPSNYPDAWNYETTNFPRWTFNTVMILVAVLPGVLLTSSLCAYGFARLKFPGRNVWFLLVLASIMLPTQVTQIPLYILFVKLQWLDTFWPLVIPPWFGGGAVNIFLLRQFFMQIPKELDEAAIIDGAGHFTIWRRIYLPLSRPALVSVAVLTILAVWNDFFGPLIYLRKPDNFTLALGLNMFQSAFLTRTDYIMAISTLMVVPMIILFLVAQRYIVQGFVTSGLKG